MMSHFKILFDSGLIDLPKATCWHRGKAGTGSQVHQAPKLMLFTPIWPLPWLTSVSPRLPYMPI